MTEQEGEIEASTIRITQDDMSRLDWIGKQIGVTARSEVARYCFRYVEKELEATKLE